MKFYIGNSKIVKGEQGLFAKSFIPKGKIMFTTFTKLDNVKTGFFELDYFQSRFSEKVNHSKNPNINLLYAKDKNIIISISLRDILPGEEITGCYRQAMQFVKNIPYPLLFNWLWFENKQTDQLETLKLLM